MTFKHNWERTEQHVQIPAHIIQRMVREALPKKHLLTHEILSGGCANLNLKLTMRDDPKDLILRIYLRDGDAAFREQKLAQLLKPTVPLPEVYFIGSCEGYRYAITEYIRGISLRDLLLNFSGENLRRTMFEAGQLISIIQSYKFPMAGFFDTNLNVNSQLSRKSYLTLAQECLGHPTVLETLDAESRLQLAEIFEKYSSLFPDQHQACLVHGDYGPENLLVDKVEDEWKITGILDWEFAFSGSWLQDVANMIRYAHHMPSFFEEFFLKGLTNTGLVMPTSWRLTVDLLNLLSLLDLLVRCSPKNQPMKYKDIRELIQCLLLRLR